MTSKKSSSIKKPIKNNISIDGGNPEENDIRMNDGDHDHLQQQHLSKTSPSTLKNPEEKLIHGHPNKAHHSKSKKSQDHIAINNNNHDNTDDRHDKKSEAVGVDNFKKKNSKDSSDEDDHEKIMNFNYLPRQNKPPPFWQRTDYVTATSSDDDPSLEGIQITELLSESEGEKDADRISDKEKDYNVHDKIINSKKKEAFLSHESDFFDHTPSHSASEQQRRELWNDNSNLTHKDVSMVSALPLDSDEQMEGVVSEEHKDKEQYMPFDDSSSSSTLFSSQKVNHILTLLSNKLDWIKEEIQALKPKYKVFREEVILEDDQVNESTVIAVIRVPIFVEIKEKEKEKKIGPWILKLGILFGYPELKPNLLQISWKGQSLEGSFGDAVRRKLIKSSHESNFLASVIEDFHKILQDLPVPVKISGNENEDISVRDFGYDLTEPSHWGHPIDEASSSSSKDPLDDEQSNTIPAYETKKENSNIGNNVPNDTHSFENKENEKKTATTLYSFSPSYDGQLAVQVNDRLVIMEGATKGWLLVHKENAPDQVGYVPENYVQMDDSSSCITILDDVDI